MVTVLENACYRGDLPYRHFETGCNLAVNSGDFKPAAGKIGSFIGIKLFIKGKNIGVFTLVAKVSDGSGYILLQVDAV
ncbi:hypothetical protein [Neisseria sp.]|uniref:hypothetical protein n=1 Tax=Neisseria sp. TaxID=192066 RepID=UPI00359FB590